MFNSKAYVNNGTQGNFYFLILLPNVKFTFIQCLYLFYEKCFRIETLFSQKSTYYPIPDMTLRNLTFQLHSREFTTTVEVLVMHGYYIKAYHSRWLYWQLYVNTKCMYFASTCMAQHLASSYLGKVDYYLLLFSGWNRFGSLSRSFFAAF